MPPPARRPIELEPGTPLAAAVTQARDALARSDAAEMDVAYQRAAGQAVGDPPLWSALAADHVEGLRRLGHATLALRRCTEYLDTAGAHQVSLRSQRAQIRSSLGDHPGARADAAAVRTALGSHPDSLAPEDSARLHRVEGLSAADSGDLSGAAGHLNAARQIFLEAGDQAGVAAIELDRRGIEVRQGQQGAVFDVLAGEPPRTVADYRLLAVALRRQVRYEEALHVLLRCAAEHNLDPALGWHVLYDLIVLLRLTRQDDFARQLLPLLQQAVATSADPAAGDGAVARLYAADAPEDAFSPQFDRRVQHARRLIIETRLDEAERLLSTIRAHAHTDRDIATWHLAAGELHLAGHAPSEIRSRARVAVGHLTEAVSRASTTALVEVRVCALRSLGHAYSRLDVDEQATECWAKAHRLEEGIAGRQRTDNVRIGMLQAVPTEYDERIRAAAEKFHNRGPEATAAIVVALEAARGATILANIFPNKEGFDRDLPGPSDLNGAWRWVSDIADGLPSAQAVWIMHSSPDRVHHAVLGPGLLHYNFFSSEKRKLTQAIDDLMACWGAGAESLELSITDGEFEGCLKKIADQVGISTVIPGLPPQVRRIAIVAGGELSDIPFAAMATPGTTEPLGLRYALSDLPCLSARLPLHQRSRRLRGERLLSVSPPDDKLTGAAHRPAHTPLNGECATLDRLREALGRRRHRQVRIDSHGQHEHDDPARSWLQLMPEGLDGRLWAEELQGMDLSGCGTLVLGACESGMAQRIGRDERVGFVRAAVSAGAAAVVAARWIAADSVAATVLDRFERYVRYLPRDLALRQAQRDVYQHAPGTPVDLPALDHPARWACWTLYGDSGWQTAAGSVRRSLRRNLDQRSRHVANI
ncbi:MAG: CHAT domain-containing protein [Pseudonocardiaceae bacterium]